MVYKCVGAGSTNKGDYPPLLSAAKNGDLQAVKHLISDADVTSESMGNALHLAVVGNHPDVVEFLVDCLREVKKDVDSTLLHLAADIKNISLHIVKCLVRGGAGVYCLRPEEKCTPLHVAAVSGNLDMVEYLIEEGADVDLQDVRGDSPLHLAAKNRHLDIVKCLVKMGAKVGLPNHYENTPLHVAVADPEMIKFLIGKIPAEEKVKVVNSQNKILDTPLHMAVRKSCFEAIKPLIEGGARIDSRNKEGETPLCLAVKKYAEEATKLLIAYEIVSKAQKPSYLEQQDSDFKREMSKYWDRGCEVSKVREEKIDDGVALYSILKDEESIRKPAATSYTERPSNNLSDVSRKVLNGVRNMRCNLM